MPDATVDVVCFDLGGVVVRIARSWAEACDRAGLEVRDEERFHQPHHKVTRKALSDAYQKGDIDCDTFFVGVADTTEGLYTAREVQAVHDAWIIEDYPGMQRLIDELNAIDSVRTACLSNTNHRHWVEHLLGSDSLHATKQIEHKMASQILKAVKPDQRIYQKAEAALSVEPSRIMFFDDLADNIDAALSRGWDAVQVDHDVVCTSDQIREALIARGLL